MSWFSAIPVIGKIFDKALTVVDDLVEDKDLANKIKARVKTQLHEQDFTKELEELKGRIKIILTEAKGSWSQRNWRPTTMLVFVAILANNYIIFPYLSMWTDKVTVLEFPQPFWALLTTGIGGYIGAKSFERIRGKRPEQEK
jgi:hypothetical protein